MNFGNKIITDGLVLCLDAADTKSYIRYNIIGVQVYSVYNGGLRSANYSVQYSDDNTNWTTAFSGVMSNLSSCGIVRGSVDGNGSYGAHPYWRYVEGSAVVGHHPRCSRIDFIDISGNTLNLITYTSDNCSDSGTYIVGTVSKDFSNGILYDRTKNKNNGTLTNGPTFNSINNGVIVFDGTNDYIEGVNNSDTNLTGDMTCEAWFRVNSTPSDWVRVIGKGDSSNRTYGLWYNVGASLFLYQRYGVSSVSPIIGASVSLNTWYHIAGTSSSTVHKLFINGSLVDTITNSGAAFYSSTQNVTIGYAGFHTYHNGYIASAKLYNRGLTASEIQQNFNAQRKRFNI